MPFQDISADQISAGAFADAYTISGSFTVGNTAGRHVVIGSDVHGADGVRLYDSDGVTPLIDANIAGTPTFIVGDPAHAHAILGADSQGADGFRLYAADGVTVLIDLNVAGTPTITGALIRTAATGTRVEMSSTAADRITFYDAAVGLAGDIHTYAGNSGLEATSANTCVGLNFDDTQMTLFAVDGTGQGPSLSMAAGAGGSTTLFSDLEVVGKVASDTAAQAVPAVAGYTSNLSVRRIGDLVQLIGSVTINAGAIPTGANVTVCAAGAIPVAYRPTRTVEAAVAHTWGGGAVPSVARCEVGSDGSVHVINVQQTSVLSVWFDAVTYWR